MGKGVKRQKGKANIQSKIGEPQSEALTPGDGQERLLNPAPQAFVLFTMKRSTFWSGFNVFVIQSHRQEGVKIFMKHQNTANIKLDVDLASLIIPSSHLGQYNPQKSNILGIKFDINACCKQRHCGDRRRGAEQR